MRTLCLDFKGSPRRLKEWMEISLLVKRSIKNSEVKNGETQLRRLHAACVSVWHLILIYGIWKGNRM